MIKTILVPATGGDGDQPTLAAALALARPFGAQLDVLHVRVDPVEIAVATAAGDGTGTGGPMLQKLIDQVEQDAHDRQARAKQIFDEFCARERLQISAAGALPEPSAQWFVETGQEPRWMATYGLTADLIVASRGTPGDDAAARSLLEAVLLETGRPLLIPYAGKTMTAAPPRIAIGWKAVPQAVHAIAGALPLLKRAEQVVILTVEEGEGRDDTNRLVRHLAAHGVAATAEHLPAGPEGAAATLATAATSRADLLVLGGYGHSRLREWVFGGFTQHLLASAPLPVLIAH